MCLLTRKAHGYSERGRGEREAREGKRRIKDKVRGMRFSYTSFGQASLSSNFMKN